MKSSKSYSIHPKHLHNAKALSRAQTADSAPRSVPPPPASTVRTSPRDFANPVDHQHPYESMGRFAQPLALRYDANRTRHSYYRQVRFLHSTRRPADFRAALSVLSPADASPESHRAHPPSAGTSSGYGLHPLLANASLRRSLATHRHARQRWLLSRSNPGALQTVDNSPSRASLGIDYPTRTSETPPSKPRYLSYLVVRPGSISPTRLTSGAR